MGELLKIFLISAGSILLVAALVEIATMPMASKKMKIIFLESETESEQLNIPGFGKSAREIKNQVGKGHCISCTGNYDYAEFVQKIIDIIKKYNIKVLYLESLAILAGLDAAEETPIEIIVLNEAPASIETMKLGKLIEKVFCNRKLGILSKFIMELTVGDGDVVSGIGQLNHHLKELPNAYYSIDGCMIIYISGNSNEVVFSKQASEKIKQIIPDLIIEDLHNSGHCKENFNDISKIIEKYE